MFLKSNVSFCILLKPNVLKSESYLKTRGKSSSGWLEAGKSREIVYICVKINFNSSSHLVNPEILNFVR